MTLAADTIVESCRNNINRNDYNINDKMIKIPGQIKTYGIIEYLALSICIKKQHACTMIWFQDRIAYTGCVQDRSSYPRGQGCVH